MNTKQRLDVEATSNPIVRLFASNLTLRIPPESGIGFDEQHAENVMILTDRGFGFCAPEYWLKNPELEIRDMPFIEVDTSIQPEIRVIKPADIEKELAKPHATLAKALTRLKKWEILIQMPDTRWCLHPTILINLLLRKGTL